MRTSQRGFDLIKSFEGLSLKAVRLKGEQYWTVGYGHYGPDVQPNQVLTPAQAEALLRKDLAQFEAWVQQYAPWPMSQNEFDALVSFTYNCGPGSLQSLVRGRTKEQVANRMLVYTHSGSEAYTQGLINRRKKERELFLLKEDDDMVRWETIDDVPAGYYRQQVQRLLDEGVLAGTKDGLNLTEDMLRCLLIAERSYKAKIEGLKRSYEVEIRELRDEINELYSDIHTLEGK